MSDYDNIIIAISHNIYTETYINKFLYVQKIKYKTI